ncbi:MAG TPA: energy transducer TonB [Terriglobales bacterium]|jgi:protein TonB|nr:energy transducer TonB [Terriglobales bacterium]
MRSRRQIAAFASLIVLMLAQPRLGMAKDKSNNGVTPPKVIYAPDPEYTETARKNKLQGIVAVHLDLAADGIPHDMRVVRGLSPDLDLKAVEAVAKWRFSPASKDGTPFATPLTVEVVFRLR